MRCAIGQQLEKDRCTGQAEKFEYSDATATGDKINRNGGKYGLSNWRLPTAREIASIRWCSDGFRLEHNLGDSVSKDGQRCVLGGVPISPYHFPNTSGFFWGSIEVENNALVVYFGDGSKPGEWDGWLGLNGTSPGINRHHVRLVHDPVEGLNPARFARAIKSEADGHKEIQAEVTATQRAERRKAMAAQEAAIRKIAAAEKSIIQKGPQSMYLLAGRALRGGSVDIGGEWFEARRIYEMLIAAYPNSEFSVRASDQLNSMLRSDGVKAGGRAQCEAIVRTCVASCPNDRVLTTLVDSNCKARCESVNCN
jgi:hypothetical protein